MGSLGVYLAQHYASAPMGDEDEIPDWVCGCICLLLVLAVLIMAGILFYIIIFPA